jgi:hypothetical protein
MGALDSRGRPDRRRVLALEAMEGRRLLTTSSVTSLVTRARHKYHEYVSELQHVELGSRATAADEMALRDAARSISAAAAGASLAPAAAQSKALAATLQLDHAPLDGPLSAPGWAAIRARLAADLDGTGVPPDLIDAAIAAMQSVARSAGVTADELGTLSAKEDSYQEARNALPSGAASLPDPGLYYTQHLRGFFRGGDAQRRVDQAKLSADLRAIAGRAHDTPAASGVLHRDAQLLEQVEAAVTSQAARQIGDAFVATFAQGTPGALDVARLDAEIRALLGPGASPALLGAADRLAADAPAFSAAVGSPADVRTIAADLLALVADGGGSPPNPFKIQIGPASPGLVPPRLPA